MIDGELFVVVTKFQAAEALTDGLTKYPIMTYSWKALELISQEFKKKKTRGTLFVTLADSN